MVLDKSATDDQLLDALRDEMGRLKAQLQQAHQVQAQLQAAAASGTLIVVTFLACSGLFFAFPRNFMRLLYASSAQTCG
jgi:CHASE3 domain sensor protein